MLILSCLKQTITLGAVTPTVTNTPEEAGEADRAEEALGEYAAVVAEIAEIAQSLNPCLKEN